ncbi:hypothetical protein AB0E63_45145, partial [Kribbella sp. NPDC026596]
MIAAASGDWLREKGQAQMDALLKANPKIDVVYSHNDPDHCDAPKNTPGVSAPTARCSAGHSAALEGGARRTPLRA